MVAVHIKQVPEYGHKASDVFNIEENVSEDGSDADIDHDTTLDRIKTILREYPETKLNEKGLFKLLFSRMADHTFQSVDYLEDLMWNSGLLEACRWQTVNGGDQQSDGQPPAFYTPRLQLYPRLKLLKVLSGSSGLTRTDEFLCYHPMWAPVSEEYDLLFSLKQFTGTHRSSDAQSEDILQFAAETSRDYLRWVVALATICSTAGVPDISRVMESPDARDKTTLPFYLQTTPDCLQGWLMRKKRHVNKLTKSTWVRRYCWLSYRQGSWVFEYAASPSGDVRHNLDITPDVVLQLPREPPSPTPYGLEVMVNSIRDSLNMSLDGYRCSVILKLRAGTKLCQVCTNKLERASLNERKSAGNDDGLDANTDSDMLLRGLYRGNDLQVVLPVPTKQAPHWPTDEAAVGPAPNTTSLAAQRRGSNSNQLKVDYGMVDLILMKDGHAPIGPATFSLGELEAETGQEMEVTMKSNDSFGRAQQHDVDVVVSLRPSRFRMCFTWWPAIATTMQNSNDKIPCHVLPGPEALYIRVPSSVDNAKCTDLKIQYQYVVEAIALGVSTAFLVVVLQGTEEISLGHICFGEMALIQICPCTAKSLCALIRDRVALSKDWSAISSILTQIPPSTPVAVPDELPLIYQSMLSLRGSLNEMHKLTEKLQTDPTTFRSAAASKARNEVGPVVGLFGKKALQTRRFCQRWYRLRLFIAKLRDLCTIPTWELGEEACSLDEHLLNVLNTLYRRDLSTSKMTPVIAREFSPDETDGPDIVETTLEATSRLDSVIKELWFALPDEAAFCDAVVTSIVCFLTRILHELNRKAFSLMDHHTQIEPAHVRMLGFLLRADSLFGAIVHKYDLQIEPDIRLSAFIDTKALITNFALAVGLKSCSSTGVAIWQMSRFKTLEPSSYFARLTSDATFRCNWVKEIAETSELIIAPICEYARNHRQIVVSCLSSLVTCLSALHEHLMDIINFIPRSDPETRYELLFDETNHRWDPRVTHLCAIINSCRAVVETVCYRMGLDFKDYELEGLPSFPELDEMFKTLAVKAGSKLVDLSIIDILPMCNAMIEYSFKQKTPQDNPGSISAIFARLKKDTDVLRGWTDEGVFKSRLMEMFAERVLSAYLINLTSWLRATVEEAETVTLSSSFNINEVSAVKPLSERDIATLALHLQDLKAELESEFGNAATQSIRVADEVLHAVTMTPKAFLDYINKHTFQRPQGREQQVIDLIEMLVAAREDVREKEKATLLAELQRKLPQKESPDILRSMSNASDTAQFFFETHRTSHYSMSDSDDRVSVMRRPGMASPTATTSYIHYVQEQKINELAKCVTPLMSRLPSVELTPGGLTLSPRGSSRRLTRAGKHKKEKQIRCSVKMTEITVKISPIMLSRSGSDSVSQPSRARAQRMQQLSQNTNSVDSTDVRNTMDLPTISTDAEPAMNGVVRLLVRVGDIFTSHELLPQPEPPTSRNEHMWAGSHLADPAVTIVSKVQQSSAWQIIWSVVG